MNAKEIIDTEKQVILGTYSRPDFVITHGEGIYLYDSEGKRYLDFIAGISVNALGHGDKQTLHVLDEQAKQLWHCSNLYYTELQVRLAKLLVENTFADKVFFGNSGAEAIEGAIKFARNGLPTPKEKLALKLSHFEILFTVAPWVLFPQQDSRGFGKILRRCFPALNSQTITILIR